MGSKPKSSTLRFSNPRGPARTVILEPWAGEYQLPAGGQLDVVAEGEPTGPLEIEVSEDLIIVYARGGTDAMLTAYRDGRELQSEHAPPDV